MDYYVAPSFEGKEFICEPYEKNGKMYVKIMGATAPREIRVYERPQASWSKTKKANGTEKRVERYNDKFLYFNYSPEESAELVGMRRNADGILGFWSYRKKPEGAVDIHSNISLSPLWGYYGSIEKEPLYEYDPIFIREEDIRIEGGYKRLIDDAWWKKEINRLYNIYDGTRGPY